MLKKFPPQLVLLFGQTQVLPTQEYVLLQISTIRVSDIKTVAQLIYPRQVSQTTWAERVFPAFHFEEPDEYDCNDDTDKKKDYDEKKKEDKVDGGIGDHNRNEDVTEEEEWGGGL